MSDPSTMRSSALLIPADGQALRRNNFDAIRLAMALLVVWSHCFALWWGHEDGEWLSLLLGGTYNGGNLGVLAFFAISGFLITLSWLRSKSWFDYLKRRTLRIYPGYLAAVSICSLIVVPAFSSRDFGSLSADEAVGMLSNLVLRNYIVPSDAFANGPVNGALWSIPYEFWCYLGVMAVGMIGLMRWRILYPLLAVAVITVRIWLDLTGRRPDGGILSPIIGYAYFWFNVLPPFLLGGAAYLYRERLRRRPFWLLVLIIATIASAHLPIADPLRTVITQTLLPPTLVYGLLYLAFDPHLPTLDATRFGDFSYGTYLFAFPIQQMLVTTLKSHVSFAIYVALSLALSLLAGFASWHLVERWFLPRMRHGPSHSKDKRPLQEETTLVAP